MYLGVWSFQKQCCTQKIMEMCICLSETEMKTPTTENSAESKEGTGTEETQEPAICDCCLLVLESRKRSHSFLPITDASITMLE